MELVPAADKCHVCDGSADSMVCSSCNVTPYCSQECQNLDWGKHQLCCYPTSVMKVVKTGKGALFVTRTVLAWEVILKEQPIMSGPRRIDDASKVCLSCYKRLGEEPNRCSKCLWTVCNEECENAPIHADFECKLLSRPNIKDSIICLNAFVPIVLTLRCLFLKEKDPYKWSKIMELNSNVDEGQRKMVHWPQNMSCFHYAHFIRTQCGLTEFEIEEIYQVTGAIMTNGLDNVFTQDGNERASTNLYALASKRVHYCIPNSYWTIDAANNIEIRSSVEIPIGHRVRSCFVDHWLDNPSRKLYLEKRFFMNCACLRCSMGYEFGSYMAGIRCATFIEKSECAGYFLPTNGRLQRWRCTKCLTRVPNKQAADFKIEFEQALAALVDNGTHEDFEALAQKYEPKVHPNHYTLIAVEYQLAWAIQKYLASANLGENSKHAEYLEMAVRMSAISEHHLKVLDIIWFGMSRHQGELKYLQQFARTLEIKLGGFESSPSELLDAIRDTKEIRVAALEILSIEPDDRFRKMVAELIAAPNFDPL